MTEASSAPEASEPDHPVDDYGNPSLQVVGIGASAGGLVPLKSIFSNIPTDSGMAFVICVHLPPDHESNLPEIIQSCTTIPVIQVDETLKAEADRIYVLSPGHHLALVKGAITVVEPERPPGRLIPIDILFRTLAEAFGRRSRAVVLSGGGSDGTLGLRRIKECGGISLAQAPADAEYDSMPRSAIASGLVDIVLPASEIPAKLLEIRDLAEATAFPSVTESEPAPPEPSESGDADPLREILTLLRVRTGHDFSDYKRPTLQRRIARRLQVHGLIEIPDYLDFLRDQPEEIHALMGDLLITVTNFFRDKEAFKTLEMAVIPKLFEGKTSADSVRVWTCGCATGEEAYSIAILLEEYAARLEDPPKIQIFASDVSERAIQSARNPTFPESVLADISAERADQYLTNTGGIYRAGDNLREKILFTHHNVLHDPPFSRIDLISCRNLLIYLNRKTQERVLDIFHFALNPDGHLFLGSSESAEHLLSQFSIVDKKHRLYRKVGTALPRSSGVFSALTHWEPRLRDRDGSGSGDEWSPGNLHCKLAELFAPPSVLVNSEMEVVHTSERAGSFLRLAGGEPSRNVFRLVHADLQLELRAALVSTTTDGATTCSRPIQTILEGEPATVRISVRRTDPTEKEPPFYLVVFETVETGVIPVSPGPPHSDDSAIQAVIERIEGELDHTRDQLRLTLEQGETSTEELRASNEELQAMNEEFRSATEELETSKEELQSLNEELTTVNHELKEKIDALSSANSDLQNLIRSTSIGILFLDRQLRIKRFTPPVEQFFNIIASDVDRPLSDLTHRLDYQDLSADARTVLTTLQPADREVEVRGKGTTFLARLSPYRSIDDRIEGVVIAFLDITQIKRTTAALEGSEHLLKIAQQSAKAGVWSLDLGAGTGSWSPECFKHHGIPVDAFSSTADNWIHQFHPEDAPHVRKLLEKAIEDGTEYNFEYSYELANGQVRWLMDVGQALSNSPGDRNKISGLTLDVTARARDREELAELLADRERDQETLHLAAERKDEFLAMLAHELRNPLAAIRSSLDVLPGSDEGRRSAVEGVLTRQVNHVVRIVDELLDVTRISQGNLQLQIADTDLLDVVERAIESERHSIESKGIRLKTDLPDSPLTCEGDRTRLVQCIVNLLHNAAKFTPKDGEITLALASQGGSARISVTDTGCGIEPDNLGRIFDMFAQAGDSESRKSGLGVGLGLVEKLVTLHQGKVTAESGGPGKGSAFTLTLPLNRPFAGQVDAPDVSTSTNEAPPIRIVIVDDNLDAAEMIGMRLQDAGHDVALAHTGRSGIARVAKFKPAVVFLDIGLPDCSGYEVAKSLRKSNPGLKLVALTGWGQKKDREAAKDAGFDHHLLKPVAFADLEKILLEL